MNHASVQWLTLGRATCSLSSLMRLRSLRMRSISRQLLQGSQTLMTRDADDTDDTQLHLVLGVAGAVP